MGLAGSSEGNRPSGCRITPTAPFLPDPTSARTLTSARLADRQRHQDGGFIIGRGGTGRGS
jgi:hypothetical protein